MAPPVSVDPDTEDVNDGVVKSALSKVKLVARVILLPLVPAVVAVNVIVTLVAVELATAAVTLGLVIFDTRLLATPLRLLPEVYVV